MRDMGRIPEVPGNSFKAMQNWFGMLRKRGLIYHPEEAPESILVIGTWERMFSDAEAVALNKIMTRLFRKFGDRVCEAAYPHFMRAAGYAVH